jgi:amino acid adenylation domain-containing protein
MVQFDPQLVHEWLRRTAARLPQTTALICGERRLSYEKLDRLSDQFAAALMQRGLRRGERVAILLDNSIEAVIALYGVLKAGGVFMVLEASMKAAKLGYVLKDAGCRVLLTHADKAPVVAECFRRDPQLRCSLIWVLPPPSPLPLANVTSAVWSELLALFAAQRLPPSPRMIEVDLAALIYTAGSTGAPKGVMATHHNMVSAARAIITYLDNEPGEVVLNILPLSFDYGLYQVIMASMYGGTVVLEPSLSFVYLQQVLQVIGRERVSGFPIVPSVAAIMLRLHDLAQYDFSSLRYITNTGAALPEQHIRRLAELFPHVKIYSMFGLTECKRVSYLPCEQLAQRPCSVGQAMANCETLILDECGREVGPGETGELVVRGSNVTQGYWGAAEATARAYRPGDYPADRRLYSGDYFKRDAEGYLYFVGRRDDMIKSRGERVSARELENTLCAMQGVAEAAVVGVPDELLGQAIKAFIVPAARAEFSAAAVRRYCEQNLETFMIPKFVEIVARLPKTPHGKIDKELLISQGAGRTQEPSAEGFGVVGFHRH